MLTVSRLLLVCLLLTAFEEVNVVVVQEFPRVIDKSLKLK
jgi:hypothetical protein